MKYEYMVDYFILNYDMGKLFEEYFRFIVCEIRTKLNKNRLMLKVHPKLIIFMSVVQILRGRINLIGVVHYICICKIFTKIANFKVLIII